MGAAVAITCDDLDAAGLRCEAAQCRDADAARRMLALALVLDGRTRGEAAELCGLQAARRPVPCKSRWCLRWPSQALRR